MNPSDRFVELMSPRAVEVATSEGSFSALLVLPDAREWKSAVVVVAGRSGIDDHIVSVLHDLARAGHGVVGVDLRVSELEGASAYAAALLRRTGAVTAALDNLRSKASVDPARRGVIGYDEGGLVALAAGYRCQVGAAVSFYGEGPMRLRENLAHIIDTPKPQAARFVCLIGGNDPSVRPEDLAAVRDRLDAFGMRHTFIVYPRTKGEFCHVGTATYRAAEALDAWQRTLHALETAPRSRHRFLPKRRRSPPH